jgi:hypothetical protein
MALLKRIRLAEVRSLDVVLPSGAGQKIRLRVVSRPEARLAILLQGLGLPLPNRPKKIENVVAKSPPKSKSSNEWANPAFKLRKMG